MMALDDVSIGNNKWTSVGRVTSDLVISKLLALGQHTMRCSCFSLLWLGRCQIVLKGDVSNNNNKWTSFCHVTSVFERRKKINLKILVHFRGNRY